MSITRGASRVAEHTLITVSVVVPVHNGGVKFGKCLDSLENCSPPPVEIVVVADGRSDGEWLRAQQKGHKTIILETRSGPAHARNIGATEARGDIILFIDADVLVEKDIIRRIQTLFTEQQHLAAVFGSYDDEPFEQDLISQYRNLLHHFVHQSAREDASTFWGACGAIRKSVFMSMGGFNPLYRKPSIEDIEFGYRLKQKGHAIRLQKDIQVTHLKHWNMFSMLKTDIFCRAIPWTELLLKQGNIILDLNLSFMARLSTLLVFLLLPAPLIACFFAMYNVVAMLCCIMLLAINGKFYFFIAKKRGLFFLLQTLPLHWLYFLYSGFSFIFVYFRNNFWRRFIGRCSRAKLFSS
jgi:glycosyltransferase involved in cell wall biosynthesis